MKFQQFNVGPIQTIDLDVGGWSSDKLKLLLSRLADIDGVREVACASGDGLLRVYRWADVAEDDLCSAIVDLALMIVPGQAWK